MSNHSHLSRALEKHSQIECLTLEYLLLTFDQSCACCFGISQLSKGKQSHFQSSLLLVTVLGLCGSWVLSRLGLVEMACCLLALQLPHYRQLNTDSRARGFFLPFSPTATQSSYMNCEILLSCFGFPQLMFQVNSINQNNSVLTSGESGRNFAEVLQKQKARNNLGFFFSSFPAFERKDPGVFSAVWLVFFQHLSFLLESFDLIAWFSPTLLEVFKF